MRALLLCASIALVLGAASAFAQSPLEGPLAAPDFAPLATPPKPKATKGTHRKSTKTARRAPPKTDDAPAADGAAQPLVQPSGGPANPVDFGMKWNGSNDNAAQTRAQNYDGSAQGTGAEVGMKLHF